VHPCKAALPCQIPRCQHPLRCPACQAQAGALPGHWPHVTLALGQGFNLTAFALSLLLVFRTNSSYDRWWEGRKLWGGVVNRTRDFVRQVGGRGAG